MSWSPKALGANDPIGDVNANPSADLSAYSGHCGQFLALSASNKLAILTSASTSLPLVKYVVDPARQQYSHSASVGRRYFFPSFSLSHLHSAVASFQVTFTTGW